MRGPAALAVCGIRFYQACLRPLMPWGCKFHPSCSVYAAEAIERHGFAAGVKLAGARLLRCRPGVFGGYDPVPNEPCHSEEPACTAQEKQVPPFGRDEWGAGVAGQG